MDILDYENAIIKGRSEEEKLEFSRCQKTIGVTRIRAILEMAIRGIKPTSKFTSFEREIWFLMHGVLYKNMV